MMDDMIRGLDDSQAVRVLTTFARAQLRAGGVAETEWTPELDRALRQDFPAEADAGRAASVSELSFTHISLLTEVLTIINLAAIFNNYIHLFKLSTESNENTITV